MIFINLYSCRARGVSGKNKQPEQIPWRGAQFSRIGFSPALSPAQTRRPTVEDFLETFLPRPANMGDIRGKL